MMTLFESILNEGKNAKLANHYALVAKRIYEDYVEDAYDDDAEEKYEDLENDLESNYKPLSRSDYTGDSHDDRY